MIIRQLHASDRAAWQHLWRGYIEFYQATIPAPQDELTWRRMLDPEYELHG